MGYSGLGKTTERTLLVSAPSPCPQSLSQTWNVVTDLYLQMSLAYSLTFLWFKIYGKPPSIPCSVAIK